MNPLISTFILTFFLSTTVYSGQLPWTRFLLNDTVSSLSIKTAFYEAFTGENLTVECTVVRWCLSPFVAQCRVPTTVRWFTPRTLIVNNGDEQQPPRKEITFSSKVVETFHKPNISEEISVVEIISTLKLNSIGFIHTGYYECSSFIEAQDFTLKVKENSAHSCTLDDQCTSGSCWENSCRCSGPQFNWVPTTKSCVKRVPIGGGCASDVECRMGSGNLVMAQLPIAGFARHLSPIRCLTVNGSSSCQCDPAKDVRVTVAVAEVEVCLPKASLGASCYFGAQCIATSGSGAFCGLNMKTLGDSSASNTSSGLVCQCADGWHPSFSSSGKKDSNQADSCSPYTRCNSSVLGFNEHYVQGSCPRNQFCRSGYCLCLPNYEFSSGNDGSCVLQRGIDVSRSSFLEQYFWEILVCIVAVVVIIFSLTMMKVIRSKVDRSKRKAQTVQRTTAVRMSMINRGGSSESSSGSSTNRR